MAIPDKIRAIVARRLVFWKRKLSSMSVARKALPFSVIDAEAGVEPNETTPLLL